MASVYVDGLPCERGGNRMDYRKKANQQRKCVALDKITKFESQGNDSETRTKHKRYK